MNSCERCRNLLARDGRLGLSLGTLQRASTDDLSALRRLVVENARREVGVRAWLRSRSRWQRLGLALLVVLVLGACLIGKRPDFASTRPLATWGGIALYLVGIVAGVSALMARPGKANEGRSRARVALAVGLLPIVVLLGVSAGAIDEAAAQVPFGRRALGCFGYGSLFTGGFLAWLWVLERSDRVSGPGALLMATSAGLLGNLALHLHCPSTEPWHLLLGHVAIVPLWALAYVLWARSRSARHSLRRL